MTGSTAGPLGCSTTTHGPPSCKRILDELPLPIASDAGLLGALGIAVALEDGLGITLADSDIAVARLGHREGIEQLLHEMAPPA